MRLVSIAWFVICLQFGLAIVNGLGVFDVITQPNDDVANVIDRQDIDSANYAQSQVSNTNVLGFGDFVKGLTMFVTNFAVVVFAFPYFLVTLGLPIWLSVIVGVPIYPLYFFALAQWLANRPEKGFR